MEPLRPTLPVVPGRPTIARTLAFFYLAGATLAGLSLPLPHGSGADVAGIAGIVAITHTVGALLLIRAGRLPGAAVPAHLRSPPSAIYFEDARAASGAVELFGFFGRRMALVQR